MGYIEGTGKRVVVKTLFEVQAIKKAVSRTRMREGFPE